VAYINLLEYKNNPEVKFLQTEIGTASNTRGDQVLNLATHSFNFFASMSSIVLVVAA
jgi:hypothetical protein